MSDVLNLPALSLYGPLWSAEATLIKLEDPTENWALRSLFVDSQPRNLPGVENILLPGTLLVLCVVNSVTIRPTESADPVYIWQRTASDDLPDLSTPNGIAAALHRDLANLLLVSGGPESWNEATNFPRLKCLAGEIVLDRLEPQNDSLARLFQALKLNPADALLTKRKGAAYLPGELAVHAGGMSIYGQTRFPWDTATDIVAPFQLARIFPDPAEHQKGYRLTIETERLTGSERADLIASWTKLSRALNPTSPLTGPNTLTAPSWVTLEIANPLSVPRVYWQLSPWDAAPASLPLYFERDQLNLLFTDQPPYATQYPPTTLAQTALDEILLVVVGENQLNLSVQVGSDTVAATTNLHYQAQFLKSTEPPESDWRETFELTNARLAFDPVQTPQFIRNAQNLPLPNWQNEQTLAAPVVWGYTPLNDGWLQLPIPNLTEQIYLDSRVAQLSDKIKPALLQGAVTYGNARSKVLAFHPDEQAWSFTLSDARQIKGQWTLELEPDLKLSGLTLDIADPNIDLDGVLWLSTGQPTAADALPSLEDWVGSLESISLRTVQPDALFPAPVVLNFSRLGWDSRGDPGATSEQLYSAKSTGWEAFYSVAGDVFTKLSEVLPPDSFSAYPPYLWRRHPHLPLVQALPLTQSLLPPNYPSASRQLMPFELELDPATHLPVNWKLAGPSAEVWPSFTGPARPAQEWTGLADLGAVSLSLPGLALDPHLSAAFAIDPHTQLPVSLRYDLPYTDELNTLAQLPKLPLDPSEVSPLPDTLKPEPPRPLYRDTFAAYWERLSERASLAAVDAREVIVPQGEGGFGVPDLIEPLNWPVKPVLSTDEYPGSLLISNLASDAPATLTLTTEAALRGLDGAFVADDTLTLQRDDSDRPTAEAYTVTAGSMAAYRQRDGQYRDQRGLLRSASRQNNQLITTPVQLSGGQAYELTSTLKPLTLVTDGTASWNFWFRDLPVQAGSFKTATLHSEQAEDVNDPEARSRKFNYLNGYEWRLKGDTTSARCSLFGLNFFPLRLEEASFADNSLTELAIVGRLQLPLTGSVEQTTLANAVRLSFSVVESQLQLTKVQAVSDICEWPLALLNGETVGEARLEWSEIALGENSLNIEGARLKFFLFEVEWLINLDQLAFSAGGTKIVQHYNALSSAPFEPVRPERVELVLDYAARAYDLAVRIAIRLGADMLPTPPTATLPSVTWTQAAPTPSPTPATRSAFKAIVRFNVLGTKAGQVEWESEDTGLQGFLFDDLVLNPQFTDPQQKAICYTRQALQFAWSGYKSGSIRYQFLPGMYLGAETNPGFATVAFAVTPVAGSVPYLGLTCGFVESLLFCQWQDSLQDLNALSTDSLETVFGASAGDITVGYTGQWVGAKWSEVVLLNGFLEVKNLISWPENIRFKPEEALLTLPAARDTARPPRLNHIRHTIRILFNQHEIPAEVLKVAAGALIFTLSPDAGWQFLAVVEHQLINVRPEPDFNSFNFTNDRRFTTVQEVRLLLPAKLAEVLEAQESDNLQTLDPAHGFGPLGQNSRGYWGESLRKLLTSGEDAALKRLPTDTLLVEASAVHWIGPEAVAGTPATSLQFLPGGTQLASLSNPADFAPSDNTSPWRLLTLPFLGRLQKSLDDGLNDKVRSGVVLSALQTDPILYLHRRQSSGVLPPLPLALSSWGDSSTVEIKVSAFDTIISRNWARLDAVALEESWFRLQHPLPETLPTGLPSVTAALPPTPARLSRPVALNRIFTANTQTYPPSLYSGEPPQPVNEAGPLWRANSLLTFPGVDNLTPAFEDGPYGWFRAGLQLISSGLTVDPRGDVFSRRYPAATLLPTRPDQAGSLPLSLAVSPYLGLAYLRPVDGASKRDRLTFAELLCLDSVKGQLLPVATITWEVPKGEDSVPVSQQLDWARQTHLRLCPTSPLAVVRSRSIVENRKPESGDAAKPLLTTGYSYLIVSDLELAEPLSRRLFRLRTPVESLRFLEGQYGGQEMPDEELHAFEVAPPQVTGVQPLYLTERPKATSAGAKWPWGLSALRLSVQFSKGQKAAVGRAWHADHNPALTLWWQAPQHSVQFRAAASGLPTAGLPPLFRAPAIKSLLPVLPQLPMPAFSPQTFLDPTATNPYAWQPVLPGAIRYLILGARPGAMLALRHQLVRQAGLGSPTSRTPSGHNTISGSVPVQHRVPRPVPLPPNTATSTALQTWASYFEPGENLAVSTSPLDEAFFGAFGATPARRLKMQLISPLNGGLSVNWNGRVAFELTCEQASFKIGDWNIKLQLVDDLTRYDFVTPAGPDGEGNFSFGLKDAFTVLKTIRARLAGRRAGSTLWLRAQIRPANSTNGFFQTLSFPLRITSLVKLPLPLEPHFIHFEDPEYNRRLASAAYHAAVSVPLVFATAPEQRVVTLAADRREYNYNSVVTLRYDWEGGLSFAAAKYELAQRDKDGNLIHLYFQRVAENGNLTSLDNQASVWPGRIVQIPLLSLQKDKSDGQKVSVQLVPGDTLQVTLTIPAQTSKPGIAKDAKVVAMLKVVETPVNAVPEAAYGLLKYTPGVPSQVECARFAWSPEASRIELINPDDLLTEVVRRRAVFQWNDAARRSAKASDAPIYAIQKITQTGSTHFPSFTEPDEGKP